MRYRVSAYPTPQDRNHHHALDSAFLAKKTRRRAKQSIGYLLGTSKTLIETGLAVLLCQVVLGYPVPDGPKPPPRTQFCVASRENLQTGQREHCLPAGSLKAVLQSVDAVMSCRVAVSYPVPDGPKPPPRTQFCVSRRENLQTGQTEHWLPAGHFKNVDRNWSCCPVVPSRPGLPCTRWTKTAATHSVLRFPPGKLADGLNRALATC